MTRNIRVVGNEASVVYLSDTDVYYGPMTDSPECSFISERDWASLVGEPLEGETFSDREKKYAESLGWKFLDENVS